MKNLCAYICFLALSLLLTAPTNAFADGVELTVLRKLITIYGSTSKDHVDFDGDGKPDVVFVGGAFGDGFLEVVGLDAVGQLQRKQLLILPVGVSSTIPVVWKDAGISYLGIRSWDALYGSTLEVYSGWPLERVRRLSEENLQHFNPQQSLITDLDADGRADFVNFNQFGFTVYSLETGVALWSWQKQEPFKSKFILVAQLDADPALEIVFGSFGRIVVVDGATQQTQEHLFDDRPFGITTTDVITGRFFPGSPGLLTTGTRGSLFRTNPWQTIWTNNTHPYSGYTWPFLYGSAGDLNGNGMDEVVYSSAAGSEIHAIEPHSGSTRVVMGKSVYHGHLLVDSNADGKSEILTRGIVGDQMRGDQMEMKLSSGVNGETQSLLRWKHETTQFTIAASSPESAFGSDFVTVSRYAGSFLQRTNAQTGETVWSTAMPYPEDWDMIDANAVALVAQGLNNRAEVMVTMNHDYGYGLLMFFDAEDGSHTRTYQLPQLSYGRAWARDSAIVTDADGRATSIFTCHSDGMRQYRYSDGALLWTMTEDHHSCRQIWSVKSGAIVHDYDWGLRAYDPVSKQELWTSTLIPLDAPADVSSGHMWLLSPVDEVQQFIAPLSDGRFFSIDANTSQPIRTIMLPTELELLNHGEIIAAPGGSIHHLLIYGAHKLHVIDGTTGASLTVAERAGTFEDRRRYGLSAVQTSPGDFMVNTVNQLGNLVFSLRIPPDLIFSGSFDSSN